MPGKEAQQMPEESLSPSLLDELAQALQAAGASLGAARIVLGRHAHIPSDVAQLIEEAAHHITQAYKTFHRLRGE
jgi:hypothetical protein